MKHHRATSILSIALTWTALAAQDQVVDPFTGETIQNAGNTDDSLALERKEHAEDAAVQRSAPGSTFRNATFGPFPNAQLPDTIVAPEGQITAFAVFDKTEPGGKGVPLYLVNRSSAAILLPSQDGDVYFKLEFQDPSGRWQRAQNHHDSWCGNSYYTLTLPPGQHLRLHVYRPAGGETATVRYRCYSEGSWTSNAGTGTYFPADQTAAEFDSLARRGGPQTLWATVSLTLGPEYLRKFTPHDLLAAVALQSIYQESKAYRRDALRIAMRWPDNAPEREDLSAILDKSWPVDPQPEALLELCLGIVSGPEGFIEPSPSFPTSPALAWRVIADLLGTDGLPDHGTFVKRAFAALDRPIASGEPDLLDAVAVFLGNADRVDEHLLTDRAKAWIGTGNPRLLSVVARILVRRGETEWLAGQAGTRPPAEQNLILRALAQSPGSSEGMTAFNRVRNPEGEVEREFWRHCARTQPIETVQALHYIGISGYPEFNAFNRTLRGPLREFLAKEAKRDDYPPGTDGYPLSQVVKFVGAWQDRDDVPLFRELLRHPSYQSSQVTSSKEPKQYGERRYRVRQAARDALIGLGESVPEDLVLEEKFVGE